MKVKHLGYDVVSCSTSELIRDIESYCRIDSRVPRWLACINPHSYCQGDLNFAFKTALRSAEWLVPDGAGIVFGSRFLNAPVKQRITGFDVFYGLLSTLNVKAQRSELRRSRVFFLGSSEQVLMAIKDRFERDFPCLEFAGSLSPPFKENFTLEEDRIIVNAVNAAKVDVLFVAMTAPKQELWIHKNIHNLDVNFVAAIGAVFDFYTGRVKRSPLIFQRIGLEWLPRLIQEPRRLWRRTIVSAPKYIFCVLKSRFQS